MSDVALPASKADVISEMLNTLDMSDEQLIALLKRLLEGDDDIEEIYIDQDQVIITTKEDTGKDRKTLVFSDYLDQQQESTLDNLIEQIESEGTDQNVSQEQSEQALTELMAVLDGQALPAGVSLEELIELVEQHLSEDNRKKLEDKLRVLDPEMIELKTEDGRLSVLIKGQSETQAITQMKTVELAKFTEQLKIRQEAMRQQMSGKSDHVNLPDDLLDKLSDIGQSSDDLHHNTPCADQGKTGAEHSSTKWNR